VIDGALATQLMARGVPFPLDEPPIRAASARSLARGSAAVMELHTAYLRAGAQLVTTHSLCLHPYALRGSELEGQTARLAGAAATLAATARRSEATRVPERRDARIAGSIGPALLPPEHPDRETATMDEIRTVAAGLAAARVDLLLLETMTHTAELVPALRGAATAGLPIWVGLTAGPRGRLAGGDRVSDAVAAALDAVGPRVVRAWLINCTAVDDLDDAIAGLDVALGRAGLTGAAAPARGAYPNASAIDGQGRVDLAGLDLDSFSARVAALAAARSLDIVGGCCGTSPGTIAALVERLQPTARARAQAYARLRALTSA